MNKPLDGSYHPPAPNFYTGRGTVLATRANLPHWNKAQTASFVTFRLADSLPRVELLKRLERRGCDLGHEVENTIQEYLDAGYGSCILREERCRRIVENALWHFAGERYALYAYVVMPNHVHVLFMPSEGQTLSGTVASWKKFTARHLNDALGEVGAVWEKESFDTLVRSERHFQTIVGYIKRNDPAKAWVAYR